MASARWSSGTRPRVWNHLDQAEPRAHPARSRAPSTTTIAPSVLEQLERAGFAVARVGHDHRRRHRLVLLPDHRPPARACALRRRRRAPIPRARSRCCGRLTEAVQVRTTYITGSRDDLRPDEFTPPALEQKLRRRAGADERGRRRARDFPATCRAMRLATCADDLAWMLERLRAVGIAEVVAVDLTRPELGRAGRPRGDSRARGPGRPRRATCPGRAPAALRGGRR